MGKYKWSCRICKDFFRLLREQDISYSYWLVVVLHVTDPPTCWDARAIPVFLLSCQNKHLSVCFIVS